MKKWGMMVAGLFLGEAGLLGLIGGALGVVIIGAFQLAIKLLIPALPLGMQPEIVAAALVASIATGLVAGLKPALDATRLSPIDALRAE